MTRSAVHTENFLYFLFHSKHAENVFRFLSRKHTDKRSFGRIRKKTVIIKKKKCTLTFFLQRQHCA